MWGTALVDSKLLLPKNAAFPVTFKTGCHWEKGAKEGCPLRGIVHFPREGP